MLLHIWFSIEFLPYSSFVENCKLITNHLSRRARESRGTYEYQEVHGIKIHTLKKERGRKPKKVQESSVWTTLDMLSFREFAEDGTGRRFGVTSRVCLVPRSLDQVNLVWCVTRLRRQMTRPGPSWRNQHEMYFILFWSIPVIAIFPHFVTLIWNQNSKHKWQCWDPAKKASPRYDTNVSV